MCYALNVMGYVNPLRIYKDIKATVYELIVDKVSWDTYLGIMETVFVRVTNIENCSHSVCHMRQYDG